MSAVIRPRIGRVVASVIPGLLAGCASGLQAGLGVSARSAADGATPPVLQGAVPFALLLVFGLLIARGFKSE